MPADPLRLSPGDDLRAALEEVLRQLGVQAAFVIQGIGSLYGNSRWRSSARVSCCHDGKYHCAPR